VKNSKGKNDLVQLPIATPDGEFVAFYAEAGLAGLSFPGIGRPAFSNAAAPAHVRAWHQMTAAALKRALAGCAPGTLPPLDFATGTAFQQSVWQALRQIRFGQTRSYGEIARAIGKPKALRAVGGACGANPIPVLVPCHRVLAANQKIGGFSGGLDWKRKLLAREGIQPRG
jgi:O-6-methylguanine DNA methyltransferase